MHRPSMLAQLMALPLLISCGGGGETNLPSGTGFDGFASVPENGNYVIEGRLTSRTLTATGGSGVVMGRTPSNENVVATLRVTNQAGDVVALAASGGSFLVDVVGTPAVSDGFLAFSQDGAAVVSSDPARYGAEYSAFGIGYNNTSSGAVFAGTFGALTSSLPSVAATYSGDSVGFYVDASGTAYLTRSDITVSTENFSTFTIVSSGTERTELVSPGASTTTQSLDFTAFADVSGASLSGTFTGTGVSGDLEGAFYGPDANEVGGTFSGTGNAGSYLGAFGAY